MGLGHLLKSPAFRKLAEFRSAVGRLAGPSPVPRATPYPSDGSGGSGAAVGGDAPIPAGPGSAGVAARN